jgi:uncharacterized membrane protein (UPF0127 family)
METTKIKLGGKEYNVLVARTEEEREQGLQNVESMEADEGCLFIHPEVGHVDYWMVDTDIPLSIIFIGEDKEVISVQEGVPNTEDYISEDNVKYVVELNAGADVEPGDILEIDGEDDFSDEEISMDPNKMYIIGSDGKPQAELLGGERIFSRKSTKVILRKAEKAYQSNSDSDYKALGRYVFQELTAQDKRKPQYVAEKKNS